MTTAVEKDRLPGEEVHLAQELRLAVADDLVVRSVEDCHLAFQDRDQGIALIADAIQHITDGRGSLLAMLGERRQLRRGQQRAVRSFHGVELSQLRLAGDRATELSGSCCLEFP